MLNVGILLLVATFFNHSYGFNLSPAQMSKNFHLDKMSMSTIKSSITVEDSAKKRIDVYLSDLLSDHSRSYYGNLCEQGRVYVNKKKKDKAYKVSKGDIIEYEIEEKVYDEKVVAESMQLDIIYEDDDMLAINKPVGMVVHPAPGSPNGTFVNGLLHHLGEEGRKRLEIDINSNAQFPVTLESDDIEDLYESDIDETDESIPLSSEPLPSVSALDLPETPEAAKASPKTFRPGVVHRLDKGCYFSINPIDIHALISYDNYIAGTSGVLIAAKHNDAVAKLSHLFAMRDITKVYLA